MDDFIIPAKTVKKVKTDTDRFETLSLTDNQESVLQNESPRKPLIEIVHSNDESSTVEPNSEPERAALIEVAPKPVINIPNHRRHQKIDSTAFLQQIYLQKSAPKSLPDDAIVILKSQPNDEDLLAILQYLQYGIENQHEFNIRAVSAKAAQMVNVLVTVTLPDHWSHLSTAKLTRDEKQLKAMILSSLTSATGIGALLTHVRKTLNLNSSASSNLAIQEAVSVLATLLSSPNILLTLLEDVIRLREKPAQGNAIWQELCSLLGGSKVLSTIAQASFKLQETDTRIVDGNWLGDGQRYSSWLASGIATTAIRLNSSVSESTLMIIQLLRRGMNLGYRDQFVSHIYSHLLMGTKAHWTVLHSLLRGLPRMEQIGFFDAMLRDLAKKYLKTSNYSNGMISSDSEHQASIGGVAAIVKGTVSGSKELEEYLAEWLTDVSGDKASLGLGIRRAVIATLALHEEKLQAVLNKCLERFCDKVSIQHAPLLQQDALAQTILLLIGYLNRLDRKLIKELSRSSFYLHSVSNRLAASAPRARVLGMIVGVAVSSLVDDKDKRMNFDIEEMRTEEAKSYIDLVRTRDEISDLEILRQESPSSAKTTIAPASSSQSRLAGAHRSQTVNSSKIISIEEVDTDSEDEEGLRPYQKPDEDASDSDEDPTLLNRSKLTTPVYIIDLIKYLQMSDKPEAVEMALKAAPSLIRRKANFGTELSENIDLVAAALINLQDDMSREQDHNLRLESMIACLIALPASMGPWLTSMYFEGDFSLSQRASLLSTIGLGTRELAGFNDDPKLATGSSTFPSQRLPGHLELLYHPIDAIAKQIEHESLQPMALAAADQATGPDVLKVRTFSSRMEVEKKAAQKAKERKTRIPKDLHKLLADSFYLPLCCRMTLILSAHTNVRHSTIFEPHILKLFLQTLTILLTSLGPHALQLPTVTRETLNLLLALHNLTTLSLDPVILPPLLQLLLLCLQVNIEAGPVAEEHLVTDFGTMVAELVTWAGQLGNVVSVPQGDNSEGVPWTVLAAGCQVKWHEVGKKFQGRMMGLMGGDFDDF